MPTIPSKIVKAKIANAPLKSKGGAQSTKKDAWTEPSVKADPNAEYEEESYYDEEEEVEYYDEEEEAKQNQAVAPKQDLPDTKTEKKEFDPVLDKLLNITAEDVLLEDSLRNFMPPEMLD